MKYKKMVILNGVANKEGCCADPLSVLTDILYSENSDVKIYHINELKIVHCTGCFGCWVKTPGICVAADESRDVIASVIQSDITFLYTPITFGGYSSGLKIIVDKFIPLASPFFGQYHGETHHTPRYFRYPRLVGIGVRNSDNKDEAVLFKTLVGRNALNLHAPSYAAETINCNDEIDTIKPLFEDVISRSDPLPTGTDIASFLPKAVNENEFDVKPKVPGNVLLIVGSPKIKNRSTSAVLGEFILKKMSLSGWQTESMTLNKSLFHEKGQFDLCSAVDRSDLILFALPLYIDSLPYLATKALEVIAKHKKNTPAKEPQRFFTIINNGFPEYHQNALALAICRRFSDQCGFSWAGSLAMGAGEALCSGQELTGTRRSGPPVRHIIKALEEAGEQLTKGNSVDSNTQNLISKTPIPIVPFIIWRWIFAQVGARWWKQQALENDVTHEDLHAMPYAE